MAVSCGDDDPTQPPHGPVRRLEVTPANAWLEIGASLPLKAEAKDSSGNVTSEPVTWTSSDTRVLSVSADGVVHAVAVGAAVVSARSGGVQTTSAVAVTAAAAPLTWNVDHQGITDVSLLGVWS